VNDNLLRERTMAQSTTARNIERPKARQLSLFPEIICAAYLVATESPKSAFYRIWIEADAGVFTVIKESGIRDRVLDKRSWLFDGFDDARKLFDRRVKSKTNPERKSPRIYTLVYNV
jgi:hypothetical protein